MWNQYRKTFAGMQVIIAIVTIGVFLLLGYSVARAAVFFAVMQLSAVIGAVWAARIRAILVRRTNALPLKGID
jgi:hypothetical protein